LSIGRSQKRKKKEAPAFARASFLFNRLISIYLPPLLLLWPEFDFPDGDDERVADLPDCCGDALTDEPAELCLFVCLLTF